MWDVGGENGVEDDYEPSFVVFNYGEDGKPHDFAELRKLGVGGRRVYDISLEGGKFLRKFLLASTSTISHKTFLECYVNPMPTQLSERMRRKGKIMIWDV